MGGWENEAFFPYRFRCIDLLHFECSRQDAAPTDEDIAPTDEDIEHFEVLMQRGDRADTKEVKKSFRRRFKKDQPVSRYERILSKAQKNEYPPGQKDSYMYV